MYSSHLGEGLGWNINQFKLISSRDYWKVSENGSNVFSIICKLRVCQITFSQEPSVDFQGKCFFIETYEFWILLMSCSSFGLCFPWKHPRIVCLNNNSSAFNKMTFAFINARDSNTRVQGKYHILRDFSGIESWSFDDSSSYAWNDASNFVMVMPTITAGCKFNFPQKVKKIPRKSIRNCLHSRPRP